MAYVATQGSTIYDIIEAMDDLLVGIGWVQKRKETRIYNQQTRTSLVIWEGIGDGTDKIFIQARIPMETNKNMYLDSMVGYDDDLDYWEQPGSLQQWLKSAEGSSVTLPMFTVTGEERFAFWLFADTYHIVGVARLGIIYESFHAGFLNPIASERQYPYPMYIAGNGHVGGASWPSNQSGSFIFPQNYSGWLRRADGVWRAFDAPPPIPSPDASGTVFPYNAHNTQLIPNYAGKETINQDNYLLIPVMLQTNNPVDVNGLIRDVYWLSGRRDAATETILVYGGDQYIMFDTKQMRGSNTYFCVKMVG